MKIILLSLFIFNYCTAQDWFPLNIGDKWQYIKSSYGPEQYNNNSLLDININKDSLIEGKVYFKLNYYSADRWFRYDDSSKVVFINDSAADYVHMNFSLSPPEQFQHIMFYFSLPYYLLANTIEGQYKSGDSSMFYKGYSYFIDYGGDFTRDSTKFISGIGMIEEETQTYHGGTNLTLIQSELNIDSTRNYFKQFYSPQIIYEPDSTINSNIFNKGFTVKHYFSQLNHSIYGYSEGVNFIDSVYLISFYSKSDTIRNNPIQFAARIPISYKYKFNFELDTTLMKRGYLFNYQLKAVDKYWEPNIVFLPLEQYFILRYDTLTTNISDNAFQYIHFNLHQNYPNPFNPSTSIQYEMRSTQFVTLKVYDVLGNEVARLVNGEKPAGNYEVEFSANKISCGVYYYQLRAGDFVETKKMILMK